MNHCLTNSDLHWYHAREMSEADQAYIRLHLEQCDACARRNASLMATHDGWVRQLQEAGLPGQLAEPSADAPSPQPGGPAIAGYQIAEEVSRGGQGIVYRAIQKSTKRQVALKVLREGPFASRAVRKRFEREIELVAGFKHPDIVTLFDSGVTADGRQYCVMDYVDGLPLDQHVIRNGLTIEQTLALFARICEAVNYAHQRGVIHRDLKPSNILIDAGGEPRVLDFGLAKQTATEQESLLTIAGEVAGTLPYLSPEQASGRHEDVDIRSDVYTLGVILYELTTGQYPHSVTGSQADVLKRIADAPPLSPGRALRNARATQHRGAETPESRDGAASAPTHLQPPAGVSDELETIILKALAKERERRYQTAGELARDSRRYLAGEPIEAKRDSGWYVLKKTIQRYKVAAAIAAAFLVVISASTVALAVMYGNQSRLLAEVGVQKENAQQAEAQAQRRFNQVRELANAFILKLDPKISDLVGATPAREFIVTTGLEYLDKLAQDSEGDLSLQQDLAAAYFKLGDVQGDPLVANLGDQEGALESYRKGLRCIEPVADAKPGDVFIQRNLCVAYRRTGKLLESMGRAEEAADFYRRAMHRTERLIRNHPDNIRLQIDMAHSYGIAADAQVRNGHLDEALAMYHKVLNIKQTLAKADPDNHRLRHELVATHDKIGRALEAQGKLAEALESHSREAAIMEELARAKPHSARTQCDLALSYDRLGLMHQRMGSLEDALSAFQESLGISEALAKGEPNNAETNANLRAAYCRIGEVQLELGRTEAALASFRKYHETSKAMAAARPNGAPEQRDLAVSFYKMAELHGTLAEQRSENSVERLKHLRERRSALQHCLAAFEDMDKRGILGRSDAGVRDEIIAEITQCEEEIAATIGPGPPS